VVFTFLLDTLLLLRNKSALASTVPTQPRLIACGQIALVDNSGKARFDVFVYNRPTAIW
jgi:hypothetical protein